MDRIDKSIQLLEIMKEIYATDCKKPLDDIRKLIQTHISDLLKEHKNKYNLEYINSVHTIDLFKIDGRVKLPKSLFEKFVRKDEGLNLLERLGIRDINDIEGKRNEIKSYFNSYEDIIGIKIITELNEDCKSVYNLLMDTHKSLKDIMVFKDINKQPKKMKNGLEIYNIKGIFKNEYGFELQIKSKINSAWGDLDHSIFYKNYDFNPIKDTVQLTMNHIGNMLNEIERHLFTIRNANSNYAENAKRVKFIEELYSVFNNEVKDKFKSNYKIDRLADILLFALEKSMGVQYSGTNLNVCSSNYYNFTEFNFNNVFLESYRKFRDSSFEATMLENFYLRLIFNNENINESTYEDKIKIYLDSIIDYLATALGEETKEDLEERGININEILVDIFEYNSKVDLFTNTKNYSMLNEWIKQILDDYEVDGDKKVEIIKLWLIALNDGELKSYLSTKDIAYIYDLMELVNENRKNISEKEYDDKYEILDKCNEIIKQEIDNGLEVK